MSPPYANGECSLAEKNQKFISFSPSRFPPGAAQQGRVAASLRRLVERNAEHIFRGEQVMRKQLRASIRASAIALVGFGAIAFASSASAACGDGALAHPASWQDEGNGGASGLFHEASANMGVHSIVGMWSFTMMAGGQTVDFGYAQWHSDGTELMNSGGRAPATENFCMGVWTQSSGGRYHLNHYALSYDSSGTLNARVNIKEDVTVAPSGATYSGPFTLDVYDPTSNALLQHVAGQVTGQRVPAN